MRPWTRAQRLGWGVADVVVVAVAMLPVAWVLSLSFKTEAALKQNTLWPTEVTLDNYRGIFQTSLFTRALVNSIGIAVLSTLMSRRFALVPRGSPRGSALRPASSQATARSAAAAARALCFPAGR